LESFLIYFHKNDKIDEILLETSISLTVEFSFGWIQIGCSHKASYKSM